MNEETKTKKDAKPELMVSYHIGEDEIKLSPSIVKNYLANGAEITMQEFKLFTELCKVNKLNPFLKEAYIIKFGTNPAQLVVGKDVFLQRAGANEQYDGRQQGVIVQKANGEVIERNGTFFLPDETLVGGWAKVYRKDQKYPTYITVNFEEVAQRKRDGSLNSNWENKSATMVEKVALVRALREAFPKDIRGMYERDELWDEPRQAVTNTTPQGDAFGEPADVTTIDAETISLDNL